MVSITFKILLGVERFGADKFGKLSALPLGRFDDMDILEIRNPPAIPPEAADPLNSGDRCRLELTPSYSIEVAYNNLHRRVITITITITNTITVLVLRFLEKI